MNECDYLYKKLVGLDRVGFIIDTNNIHYICSPSEYYDNILTKISSAKENIMLCSLYIGDGDKESKLLDLIENKLINGLNVVIMLDGARQLRSPKTYSRLLGLTNRGFNLKLSLFRNTYNRWGFKQFGTKFIESLCVSHLKLLLVDDVSIFSGYF